MESAAGASRGRSGALADPESAFTSLYRDHHAAILAYCRRRLSAADAQDAAAEVFSIAWNKIGDVPSGGRQRTWLYGVAYRVLGHHWRGRDRRRRLHQRIAGMRRTQAPTPEVLVVQRAEDRRVIEAVHRLRPTDREILMLAGWEELPHAEIAEILGISVAAVDQRFHRAKKRLAAEYVEETRSAPPSEPRGGKA